MRTLTPLEPWIARKIGCAPEALTRERLEAYQLEQLRQTLGWVRTHSRFYQARLAPNLPSPDTLSDWSAVPFTSAEDIQNQPFSFPCVSQSEIERVVTVGTADGPPKRLYFTAADQERTRDFFRVGMSTFTAPGDRVLILLPCERPGSVGDLLADGLERLGAVPVRYGLVDDVEQVLARLHEEDANVLAGTPRQVLALVRAPAAGQVARPEVKSVLLTAEYVPDAIATAVEAAWGCTVYNHYGTVEMGLGGGVECAVRSGYHLREADLYVEVVDPVSGEPLPDGERGEVVFTTLLRRGMPLLRYRTGDAARFLPEPCRCGTVLRRLEKVCFRWDDRVEVAPGHVLIPADLDEALYAVEGVLGYTFELTDETLRVTIHSATPGVDAAARAALSALPAVRAARLKLAIQLQSI